MVTNIPSASDFRVYGLRYLNLAWEQSIAIVWENSEMATTDPTEPELQEDLMKAAQPELGTALTLVQQGAEFLLKSKIAEVSPWLLLSRDPNGWPRRCEQEDTAFADFHVLDAQDLVKVYNTFCTPKLSEEFTQSFRTLRLTRNAIMHTVDRRIQPSLIAILEHILLFTETLEKPHAWPKLRLEFLATTRYAMIDGDAPNQLIAREFVQVTRLLDPSIMERYFGFSRKGRKYLCTICCHASEYEYLECRTAVLTPNTPVSTQLTCFVCGQNETVVRQRCIVSECKGNVIDPEWDECLTCGSTQTPTTKSINGG